MGCVILVRERVSVCGGKGKPVDSSVLTSIKYLRNVQFRALQEETHTQRNTAGERNSEHCVLVCAMTRQKGQCCARWGFIIWRAGKNYYINIVFSSPPPATLFQTSYRSFSRPKSFPEKESEKARKCAVKCWEFVFVPPVGRELFAVIFGVKIKGALG